MNSEVQKIEDLPIIDLEQFLNQDVSSERVQTLCKNVAQCFHDYGILLIRDPRAKESDNSQYIDLMEKYFESRGQQFYNNEEVADFKPQYHYQVGACPPETEIARDHAMKIRSYPEIHKPVSPVIPIPDAKWRFMWKIGERPAEALDNFPQCIPTDFPDWEAKMNHWGYKMLDAVHTVAEMAAIGMGLDKDTFTSRLQGGAHLLAPTGSDLKKHEVGTIFAGFHYDIAFLTIHGKSRFPGLYVWSRKNQKIQVKVPEGCLLLQSGKLFEHISGGYVLPGFHEVVYTDQTKAAMERAIEQDKSTWRVSSTMFTHFKWNVDCSPMAELSSLAQKDSSQLYPKLTAYDILMEELRATNMTSD